MEATRRRLEALLAELQQATATADDTIAEVKAALRELENSRTAASDVIVAPQGDKSIRRTAYRSR